MRSCVNGKAVLGGLRQWRAAFQEWEVVRYRRPARAMNIINRWRVDGFSCVFERQRDRAARARFGRRDIGDHAGGFGHTQKAWGLTLHQTGTLVAGRKRLAFSVEYARVIGARDRRARHRDAELSASRADHFHAADEV